jgi:Fe-S oxidoreductase
MKSVRTYTPPVLRIISSNIAKSGNPLGLKQSDCTAWARGLELPGRGETILYTGGEYQMTAYLGSLVEALKKVKFRDSLLAAGSRFGMGLMKAYSKATGRESERYNRILRMAALTLRHLNVDYAYLEGEQYSGALLYEYGLFEEFAVQAKRVAAQFQQSGVKRIIALSPHSAEVFAQVYSQFIEGFDLEVVPYVSAVAGALGQRDRLSLPEAMTVTLHDPCHLARALRVTETPREALGAITNLELREVTNNRELTSCCGAPVETIFPEISEFLATRRAEELAATGAQAAVTLCPFCHVNLSKGAALAGKQLKVVDFIEVVHSALEAGHAGS